MSLVYGLVHNIPATFHSKDLRRFFSNFVHDGRFECFHFRHRPEVKIGKEGEEKSAKTCCCLVKFTEENREKFILEFHMKKWVFNDSELGLRCCISRVKISENTDSTPDSGPVLKSSDLSQMLELKPSGFMPNGNVGTPSRHFMDLIRQCKLPSSVIKKLGLDFPQKTKSRLYSKVPFEYKGKKSRKINQDDNIEEEVIQRINPPDPDSDPDDDNDDCEEWERHEALHDDVTEQERTKEKLCEEEMEVVWEKGGPGLVFYTDAFHWEQQEPDTDEKWADDWDVDMSIYYDKGTGDKDAKDFAQMRREKALERGEGAPEDQSVFRKGKEWRRKRHLSDGDTNNEANEKFAHFEKYNKRIGRKDDILGSNYSPSGILTDQLNSFVEDDRRAHHNALERKRRDHIKDSFLSLKQVVPTLHGERASRALILKKAAEHISSIRSKIHAHELDIEVFKKQNEKLERQINAIENNNLQAERVPTNSNPVVDNVSTCTSHTVSVPVNVMSCNNTQLSPESADVEESEEPPTNKEI